MKTLVSVLLSISVGVGAIMYVSHLQTEVHELERIVETQNTSIKTLLHQQSDQYRRLYVLYKDRDEQYKAYKEFYDAVKKASSLKGGNRVIGSRVITRLCNTKTPYGGEFCSNSLKVSTTVQEAKATRKTTKGSS